MESKNKTEELKRIFIFLAGKDDNQDNLTHRAFTFFNDSIIFLWDKAKRLKS